MIALPYPPSVNAIWRNIVIRGAPRTVLSRVGREYRAQVQALLAGQLPLEGDVAVTLHVYRPRRIGDLDNAAKAVLDALKGFLFVDDSQVVELHMRRGDDKANPRVEVEVYPATDCTCRPNAFECGHDCSCRDCGCLHVNLERKAAAMQLRRALKATPNMVRPR